MTRAITRFFASKNAGLGLAVVAIVFFLLSQLRFLPLHKDMFAVGIGLLMGLNGFTRAFSDDWRKHASWRGDFLSKAFFWAFLTLVLMVVFIVSNDLFLKLY